MDHQNQELAIPSIARIAAAVFAALIIVGLLRAPLAGESMPLLMPLATGIASAVLLGSAGAHRDPAATLMRVGFHIGLFTFFLSFPILSPDELSPSIGEETHWLTGWALALTLAGFEAVYLVNRPAGRTMPGSGSVFDPKPSVQRWLLVVISIGLACWLLTIWDYANSAEVSMISVLMAMRGQIEDAKEGASGNLGAAVYLLGMGISAAAIAASLLLTAFKRVNPTVKAASWAVVFLCAMVGFLRGSRAIFLYSFVPLIVTLWIVLSSTRVGRSVRWAWIAAASMSLIIVWGAMSAMRGADIRAYQGGWENISPVVHVQGAFDIYSAMADIVTAFPEQIGFEHGASLVPLAVGWVPRAWWPEKPYPFSLYANIINGETLEVRRASIAVGLPGEGYGNFGLIGAALWGALMGLGCRKGDDFIGRLHPENPLRLYLAGLAGIWAAMIVRGGVPEMFYMGLNVIAIPWLLSIVLSRRAAQRVRASLPRDVRKAHA